MLYSLTGEPIKHQRFALPESLHAAWKHMLMDLGETQPEWFLRKVQEAVAQYEQVEKRSTHAGGA